MLANTESKEYYTENQTQPDLKHQTGGVGEEDPDYIMIG
jgi:hypothetical protein